MSDVEEDDSAIGNSESVSAAPAAIPTHPPPPAHNDNLVAEEKPPPRPARHIPGTFLKVTNTSLMQGLAISKGSWSGIAGIVSQAFFQWQ